MATAAETTAPAQDDAASMRALLDAQRADFTRTLPVPLPAG